MEETRRRTASGRNVPAGLVIAAVFSLLAGGCAGRYAGPRALAGLGAVAVLGGGTTWAVGEGGTSSTRGNLTQGGLVSVAVGLAAIAIAGGWMAASVACKADPDCDEEEQCREIPAPPGGIPYKQCMAR